MLPSQSQRSWVSDVPDSNPAAKSFRFDACFNGVRVLGTAVARRDQIELYPVPEVCIEIPLDGFTDLSKRLLVAAHTRPA